LSSATQQESGGTQSEIPALYRDDPKLRGDVIAEYHGVLSEVFPEVTPVEILPTITRGFANWLGPEALADRNAIDITPAVKPKHFDVREAIGIPGPAYDFTFVEDYHGKVCPKCGCKGMTVIVQNEALGMLDFIKCPTRTCKTAWLPPQKEAKALPLSKDFDKLEK
jgi:hypothetical protein